MGLQQEVTMIDLLTWSQNPKYKFRYEGSVDTGINIYFGKGGHIQITSEQWQKLLNEFANKTVKIGTSRDAAPSGSLGDWLNNNITKTAIASYVGAILIHEGYAEKNGSWIKF